MADPVERALARVRITRRPYTGAEEAQARLSARIARHVYRHALTFDDQVQAARTDATRTGERACLPRRLHHRHLRTHDLTNWHPVPSDFHPVFRIRAGGSQNRCTHV